MVDNGMLRVFLKVLAHFFVDMIGAARSLYPLYGNFLVFSLIRSFFVRGVVLYYILLKLV